MDGEARSWYRDSSIFKLLEGCGNLLFHIMHLVESSLPVVMERAESHVPNGFHGCLLY